MTFVHGGGADGRHLVSLFQDGTLVATTDRFERSPTDLRRHAPFQVGHDGGCGGGATFGRIADVRISSVDRYPLRPADDPDGRCSEPGDPCFVPAPCLPTDGDVLAHWPLDDNHGEHALDVGPIPLDAAILTAGAPDAGRWVSTADCSLSRVP